MTGTKVEYIMVGESKKLKEKMVRGDEEFVNLLKELQLVRVKNGKETLDTCVSLTRLTRTITNMIRANPQLFQMLAEVDIENV